MVPICLLDKIEKACRYLALIVVLICLFLTGKAAASGSPQWPREIETPKALVVIYQPQLETFKNDRLTARAAVSVQGKEVDTLVFGAVWFDCRVSTDLDSRMVTLLDVKVTAAKFPDADPKNVKQLTDLLESEIPTWNLNLSLDNLLAGLELAERQQAASEALNTTPPKVYVEQEPSLLVIIDGDPILRDVDKSSLQRVVNTPFFMAYDPSQKTYYLNTGDYWFSTGDVMKAWKQADAVPKPVEELYKKGLAEFPEEEKVADTADLEIPVPKIIVSKEPAELIVSVGKPEYSPVQGTDLLYMSNTESDVFMEIATQRYFVLLSGRWYESKAMAGPWEYVRSDSLPEDFKNIPVDWEKEHVRASIAGTREAKEAVLEAEIPQTAEVDRETATVDVKYDGDPKFDKIENTEMKYAVNTSYSVIETGGKYYCCHDAVWYVAVAPRGPWVVCVSVPQVIYTIPPSCPVYNVKYVYVYRYTPTVVYVGYTPGYLGCYVHGGVIVYGTGYHYHPWYGTVYYPRPVTYGFSVRYNPWTGWGVGVTIGGPHVRIGIGWGGGGWWGPPYYRPPYHRPPGYRPPGYRPPGYRPPGYRPPHHRPPGYHPPGHKPPRPTPYSNRNMYNNRKDVRRTGGNVRPPGAGSGPRPANPSVKQPRPSTRPNNVYSDPKGNVYRKTDQGWQQRSNKGWQSSGGGRPSTGRPAQRPTPTQQNLNRQSDARSRGNARTQSYQGSRGSSASRSRGGGGGRRK